MEIKQKRNQAQSLISNKLKNITSLNPEIGYQKDIKDILIPGLSKIFRSKILDMDFHLQMITCETVAYYFPVSRDFTSPIFSTGTEV